MHQSGEVCEKTEEKTGEKGADEKEEGTTTAEQGGSSGGRSITQNEGRGIAHSDKTSCNRFFREEAFEQSLLAPVGGEGGTSTSQRKIYGFSTSLGTSSRPKGEDA